MTDYVGYDDDSGGGTELFFISSDGSRHLRSHRYYSARHGRQGRRLHARAERLATRLPGNAVIAVGDSAVGSLGEDSPTWELRVSLTTFTLSGQGRGRPSLSGFG